MGPQTHDDDSTEDEPYTAEVGPEGAERLIFAKNENWTNPDNLILACSSGYVDVEDYR
jgi:hypothetical protein